MPAQVPFATLSALHTCAIGVMALIYLNSLVHIIGFELNVSITYLHAEAEKKKHLHKGTLFLSLKAEQKC